MKKINILAVILFLIPLLIISNCKKSSLTGDEENGGTNLINNGDFSTGDFTYWTNNENDDVTVEGQDQYASIPCNNMYNTWSQDIVVNSPNIDVSFRFRPLEFGLENGGYQGTQWANGGVRVIVTLYSNSDIIGAITHYFAPWANESPPWGGESFQDLWTNGDSRQIFIPLGTEPSNNWTNINYNISDYYQTYKPAVNISNIDKIKLTIGVFHFSGQGETVGNFDDFILNY